MFTPWNTARGRKRDSLRWRLAKRLMIAVSDYAHWWGRSLKGRKAIRHSSFYGVRCRRRVCMHHGACLKFRTALLMSTARCAGDLVGSLVHLKWLTRWGSTRLPRRFKKRAGRCLRWSKKFLRAVARVFTNRRREL